MACFQFAGKVCLQGKGARPDEPDTGRAASVQDPLSRAARQNANRRKTYAARKSRASIIAAAAAAAVAAVVTKEDSNVDAQTTASKPESEEAEEDVTAGASLVVPPPDSALQPPAKRRKGAKPKPEPVPFAHGPRINSDVEEEVLDLDDLVADKVNRPQESFISFPLKGSSVLHRLVSFVCNFVEMEFTLQDTSPMRMMIT